MIEEPRRLPRSGRQMHHHEVDIEPHAHPGEPRHLVTTDHESCPRESVPRSANRGAREGGRVSRDRL